MRRQPLRHGAQQLHPARFEAEPARSQNAADHDEQRHGFVLEKNLPEHEHRQGDASNGQRGGIGFTQVLQEVAAVHPEIAVGTVDAEQLGQLRAGEEQGDAALEPDHHALGDEIDDRTGLGQPRDERDERHEQGRARRQRPEAGRVASRNFAQRRADEQGNGGGDRDGRVARAAEQPEDQPAKQAGVKSRLGRQVGQRGVAQPGRQQVGGERDAGDDVTPQPGSVRRIAAIPAPESQRASPAVGVKVFVEFMELGPGWRNGLISGSVCWPLPASAAGSPPTSTICTWSGCAGVQVDVALREGNDDPVLRKRAGDHQAQVAGDLGGVGPGDIHPETQFEGQRAVAELGEQHLRLGLFLHQPMPLAPPRSAIG